MKNYLIQVCSSVYPDLNILIGYIYMFMCFSSRSYISFDILRRVLSDYFGYDVLYVMNITDIDDKIIKRARQDHLYDKYIAGGHNLQKNLDDAKSVLEYVSETVKKTTDSDKKDMFGRLLDRMTGAIEELEVAVKSKDEEEIQKAHEVLTCLEYLHKIGSLLLCHIWWHNSCKLYQQFCCSKFNPYPTAFPYGNGMVLHFYQQQESSTTKTVHKVINKGLNTYV